MSLVSLARDAEALLGTEPRLVRLRCDKQTVFVGDIHGDADAVDQVLARFVAPGSVVVFLGDVVDRGPSSREALARVLLAKLERPEAIFLLMGNHEAWDVAPFSPADFWESLAPDEASSVGRALLRLPFSAWHEAGVLALHGAAPDLVEREDLSEVVLLSRPWRDITWGDWQERGERRMPVSGRPTFGRAEFTRRMEKLGARALVRSHQPDAPTYLFDERCLTLFTTNAYGQGPRRVAVLPPAAVVRSARDLTLVEL